MRKFTLGLCNFLLALLTVLATPRSHATPSTFESVIGSALLCQDEINPPFFQDYLTAYFNKPTKTEGGAYWYKPDGVLLFGMEVDQIFVSTGADQVNFVGVIFNSSLAEARQRILQSKNTQFSPNPSEKILRSALGSHLMEYGNTKAKLFCVKYRVGQ